jgi:hypothetical protein
MPPPMRCPCCFNGYVVARTRSGSRLHYVSGERRIVWGRVVRVSLCGHVLSDEDAQPHRAALCGGCERRLANMKGE